MPHIHTAPGQIDFVANVFVVYKNKVLFRFHDKYHVWLMPGGHIELNETPEEAALREIEEEIGLEVELWKPAKYEEVDCDPQVRKGGYRELIPPEYMDIHWIDENHRHIGLVYFAKAKTDKIIEPDGREKSGGCIWLTKEEVMAHQDIHLGMKRYALKALELLGKE